MRTKVEVIYCDLCLPRRVPSHTTVTITGLPGGGRPVQRDLCLRHGRMLKGKPELEEPEMYAPVMREPVSEGSPMLEAPPGQSRWGPTMLRLMPEVLTEPGLHPHEYATKIGVSRGAVNSAARKLRERGFLVTQGTRKTARYYPTKKAKEVRAA